MRKAASRTGRSHITRAKKNRPKLQGNRSAVSQCAALGPAACTCVRARMRSAGRDMKSTHSTKRTHPRRIRTHVACYSRPLRDANQGCYGSVSRFGRRRRARRGRRQNTASRPDSGGALPGARAGHLRDSHRHSRQPLRRRRDRHAARRDHQCGADALPAAASFLATAVWMLIPDRPAAAGERPAHFGAYGTSVISFFLLEIGDKTQIATVALAAKYHALAAVVAGTTLGMMLADVPVVLLGEAAAKRLPLKWVRGAAAAAFVVLALLVLLGVRL